MEEIRVPTGGKAEKYEALLPQLSALVAGEPDLTANLANVAAALREAFGFFWVGFYLVKGNQLVLGPFQGPVACTRIGFGQGVVGACYARREAIVVPDVTAFPGHIACNALSQSEVVVPGFRRDDVFLVLDVDSDQLNAFDETDTHYLSQVVRLIS